MKKHFKYLLLALTMLSSSLIAEYCHGNVKVGADLGYRYRRDRVDIEVTDTSATLPLEIHKDSHQFTGVDMNMVYGAFKLNVCDALIIQIYGDYGFIKDGHGRHWVETVDEIHINDFRSRIKDDYTWDIWLGAEAPFNFKSFDITPSLGYCWNVQNYNPKSFNQFNLDAIIQDTVIDIDGELTNKASWDTFYVGCGIGFKFCREWRIFGDLKYHYGNFVGKLKDTRTLTISSIYIDETFSIAEETHMRSSCHGYEGTLGLNYDLFYNLHTNTHFTVLYQYQKWNAAGDKVKKEIDLIPSTHNFTFSHLWTMWSLTLLVGFYY